MVSCGVVLVLVNQLSQYKQPDNNDRTKKLLQMLSPAITTAKREPSTVGSKFKIGEIDL